MKPTSSPGAARSILTSRFLQRSLLVIAALLLAILLPFAMAQVAAHTQSVHSLLVRRSLVVPVPEVSAFALQSTPQQPTPRILVLGDKSPRVAELELEGDRAHKSTVQNLRDALGVELPGCDGAPTPACRRALETTTGQWEAAALDSTSRLWALQESTRMVMVFSPDLRRVESRIHLELVHDAFFHLKKNAARRASGTAPLTSGEGGVEGLALLPNGHLLVAFQSKPASLVEFGPSGTMAGGWNPAGELPLRSANLPLETTYVSLEYWTLPGLQANCSLNDLATEASTLHILSSRCKAIFSVEMLTPGVRIANISRTLSLPSGLNKPEALAALAPGLFLVGDDAAPPASPNVHILEEEFARVAREQPQASLPAKPGVIQSVHSLPGKAASSAR